MIKLARLSTATKLLLLSNEPSGKGRFFEAKFNSALKLALTPGP